MCGEYSAPVLAQSQEVYLGIASAMFENLGNKQPLRAGKRYRNGYQTNHLMPGLYFTAEQVAELMLRRPNLRMGDSAGNAELAELLVGNPDDQHVQELFRLVVQDQVGQAIVADDEFLGAYPPKGSIVYPDDFLALGHMPTGDQIGIIISQLTGNVLLVGPTKSAKTSLLTILLSFPELLKTVRIVAFVKKQELRHLATMPHLHDSIIVFKLGDLRLCYFEPPPGVPEEAWNNESTRIFAGSYQRYSAQRLMGEKVTELMANHPPGKYPVVRQLVKVLDAFKPRFGMREAGYKESILWCLKDLLNCTSTGGTSVWDYSSSTFLSELYSTPGLCIIEAEALPQGHLTFVATYFMRWLYLKRVYAGEEVL
jgi:hypothetical protein